MPAPPTHSFGQQPGFPCRELPLQAWAQAARPHEEAAVTMGTVSDPRAWDPAVSPHTDQGMGLRPRSRWALGCL